MFVQIRTGVLAAAFAALVTPAFAQKNQSDLQLPKEVLHAQMRDVVDQIDALKGQAGTEREVQNLRAWLSCISESLGGDLPAGVHNGLEAALQTSGAQFLSAPSCGAALTTTNVPGVGGPISPPMTPPPFTGTTFTATVSGVGTYLWDVNLNTAISHTFSADLDIFLESPAGTSIRISTDNGGVNDNVFNGTTWDDNVNLPCVDFVYVNNVPVPSLSPEGRLAAFRGEDPNGVWTLRIFDDLGADVGNVNSFSVDVSTLAAAPSETTANVTESPALAIPDAGNLSRTLAFASADTYLSKVSLFVEITHPNPTDLDITLTSPGGTVVVVTTDNGSTLDNVFNGTRFDHDNLTPVTDQVYVNNVAVAQLSPEGSTDNFLGQDPNGLWTLSITDDLAANVGALVRWDLDITTTTAPVPSAPTNFVGTTGPIPDFVAPGAAVPVPTLYTTLVSGVGTSLWDVDLSTIITHTSSADIDMTLTSPTGTVVTITTDNGGTNDNCFNGTLWDDNVNDGVMDRLYTNNVTVATLTPEGNLDGFRGENPNGIWTLTITDDALADNGTLNSWSLDVATLATAPAEVATTLTLSPGTAIPDNVPAGITSVIAAAGLGTNTTEVELFIQIPHTFAADLDVTLTSPAGTVVKVSTDNGGGNDNTFNGTLFDADAPTGVTDHVFVNNVTVATLQPEVSFANFKGQDPNGNWTLTCIDDLGIDLGTLVRWDLTIRTCSPAAFNGFCFGDGVDPLVTNSCPCMNFGALGRGCASSFNANGAQLTATGTPALDNVVLTASGVNASGNAIFMRGNFNNVVGAVFGDGVRCVDGTLIRRTKPISSPNVSTFPAPADTVTLSTGWGAANNTPPGSAITAYYMAYYRNAAAIFCPPETFNGTNGFVITW